MISGNCSKSRLPTKYLQIIPINYILGEIDEVLDTHDRQPSGIISGS
jgi:hypothetical protein